MANIHHFTWNHWGTPIVFADGRYPDAPLDTLEDGDGSKLVLIIADLTSIEIKGHLRGAETDTMIEGPKEEVDATKSVYAVDFDPSPSASYFLVVVLHALKTHGEFPSATLEPLYRDGRYQNASALTLMEEADESCDHCHTPIVGLKGSAYGYGCHRLKGSTAARRLEFCYCHVRPTTSPSDLSTNGVGFGEMIPLQLRSKEKGNVSGDIVKERPKKHTNTLTLTANSILEPRVDLSGYQS